MTDLEIKIRKLITDYLCHNLPLSDLRDRQVDVLIEAERSGDEAVLDIANELELLFAEVTVGHRTEEQFKNDVFLLSTNIRFEIGGPSSKRTTPGTSVSEATRFNWGYRRPPSFVVSTTLEEPSSVVGH